MKPKQFFFILLGALAVILIVAGSGYYFALNTLRTKANNESNQLALENEDSGEITTLHKVKVQYDKIIEPVLPLMDAALPTQKKQTQILAQLQDIASQVGLTITSVNMPAPVGLPSATSQTSKTGTVLALPISFQLSGTYQQLQSFTEDVENLNRFTDITNLAISHPAPTEPIVYSISLNAYILP
jgi:Tfp pilus assembly protein PilO